METFEEHIQIYCNEISILLGSYSLWKELNYNIKDDDNFLTILNSSPRSWIAIRRSLQVTYFTVLHNMFDGDQKSFSVFDLLQYCIKNIEFFKKENLKKRKIQDLNGEPDWLEEYIENTHEFDKNDFYRLKSEISKKKTIYNKKYRKIRNKILIHKDKEFIGKENSLWNETEIMEFEEIIWTLANLETTLFNFYYNGRKPLLDSSQPDLSRFENDFNLLKKGLKQFKP